MVYLAILSCAGQISLPYVCIRKVRLSHYFGAASRCYVGYVRNSRSVHMKVMISSRLNMPRHLFSSRTVWYLLYSKARARHNKMHSPSGPRFTPGEDQPGHHRQPEGEEPKEECSRETSGDWHSNELERGHGYGLENSKSSRNHSKCPR